MSTIIYTATRNLEPGPLGFVSNEISFADADNSMSCTNFDMSVAEVGNILTVLDSLGNDWSLPIETVSAGKLTFIDLQELLVDEAAGALIKVSTTKRGGSHEMEIGFQTYDVIQEGKSKRAESLSGKVETIFYNEKQTISIKTAFIEEADVAMWREFISSVLDGSVFTVDLTGTLGVDGDPVNVILDGRASITRVNNSNYYTASFKVRVI